MVGDIGEKPGGCHSAVDRLVCRWPGHGPPPASRASDELGGSCQGDRCMAPPHHISAVASSGRSKSAMVASDWTDARSWSARKGLLINRYRGMRCASGMLTSIGAWPVV